jgi:hypothetical protein
VHSRQDAWIDEVKDGSMNRSARCSVDRLHDLIVVRSRMSNEESLCEALVRLLEEEFGPRADVSFPERDQSGPPVEMRLRVGEKRIAIEHTLVEPFPLAIQTGKEFVELTAEIERQLHGNMPKPGTYSLVFPVHPTEGRHRRTHGDLREKLTSWII